MTDCTWNMSIDGLAELRSAWAASEARAEAAEQARSRFLARISHDLLAPLDSLAEMTGLMELTGLNGEQRCMLERMREAGEAMSLILAEAIDQAEHAVGRIVLRSEPFPLGEAVRSSVLKAAGLAARKGLCFGARIDPSAERAVMGDAGRLGQIIAALVDNAVKFTNRGSIGVSADIDDAGCCRIVVSDTGVGIDPANQADLFDGFRQGGGSDPRPDRNPGAGLAQARQLADLMGARIECQSMPRVGSTFVLTVPMAGVVLLDEQEAVADPPVEPVVLEVGVSAPAIDNPLVDREQAPTGVPVVTAAACGLRNTVEQFNPIVTAPRMPVMAGPGDPSVGRERSLSMPAGIAC